MAKFIRIAYIYIHLCTHIQIKRLYITIYKLYIYKYIDIYLYIYILMACKHGT